MRRVGGWCLLFALLVGCSSKGEEAPPTSASSASAVPATSARKGTWSVTIRERTPDDPPDGGTSRTVALAEGKVSATRATPPGEEALDQIDEVLTSTDWDKMKMRTSLEGAVAGGTIVTITVTVNGTTHEVETANPSKYPALAKLVGAVGPATP